VVCQLKLILRRLSLPKIPSGSVVRALSENHGIILCNACHPVRARNIPVRSVQAENLYLRHQLFLHVIMMAGGGEKEAMLIYSRDPDSVCHRGDVVYRASSRLGDVELPTPPPALGRRLTDSGDTDLNQGPGTNKLLEAWL